MTTIYFKCGQLKVKQYMVRREIEDSRDRERRIYTEKRKEIKRELEIDTEKLMSRCQKDVEDDRIFGRGEE